jgi:phospholipase C
MRCGLQVAGLEKRSAGTGADAECASVPTATPIQHLVGIFQEDVPFDHYFGKDSQCHEPDG